MGSGTSEVSAPIFSSQNVPFARSNDDFATPHFLGRAGFGHSSFCPRLVAMGGEFALGDGRFLRAATGEKARPVGRDFVVAPKLGRALAQSGHHQAFCGRAVATRRVAKLAGAAKP